MSRLSLLPFPPQNQPAPPSNCPAQTEPSRRKLPALQGLAVLSRLRRVSAPCTTAISFPLARLAAKMLCRSWSHHFFFFGGRRKALLPYPSARILPGQHGLGGRGGYGPSTRAPSTPLPQEGPLGGSSRSLPTGCWPQGQVATEQAGVQPEGQGHEPSPPPAKQTGILPILQP